MLHQLGGYGVATGGPLAWGLCYNREMSPSQSYCDDTYKYTYPCSPGAEYYGRGALPIYWYVYNSSPFVFVEKYNSFVYRIHTGLLDYRVHYLFSISKTLHLVSYQSPCIITGIV